MCHTKPKIILFDLKKENLVQNRQVVFQERGWILCELCIPVVQERKLSQKGMYKSNYKFRAWNWLDFAPAEFIIRIKGLILVITTAFGCPWFFIRRKVFAIPIHIGHATAQLVMPKHQLAFHSKSCTVVRCIGNPYVTDQYQRSQKYGDCFSHNCKDTNLIKTWFTEFC